jgi:hypothetical protein
MPRDGSLTLCDLRGTTLSIVCAPCGKRGRYSVAKLIVQHEAKLTANLNPRATKTNDALP